MIRERTTLKFKHHDEASIACISLFLLDDIRNRWRHGSNHIRPSSFQKIYGIDIHPDYLGECKNRFSHLAPILECLCIDLMDPNSRLSKEDFLKSTSFVSDSPYLHNFDSLEEVHVQMEDEELTNTMRSISYPLINRKEKRLPNGKKLIQLDYQKMK